MCLLLFLFLHFFSFGFAQQTTDKLCKIPLDQVFSSVSLRSNKDKIIVQSVEKKSLWESLGLRKGDQILLINHEKIDLKENSTLPYALNRSLQSKRLEISILRNKKKRILSIKCKE